VIAEDAISSVAAGMHEFAAQAIFPMIGTVRSTEEIIAALR
jgi:hypothetical protein